MKNTPCVSLQSYLKIVADKTPFKAAVTANSNFGTPSMELLEEKFREKLMQKLNKGCFEKKPSFMTDQNHYNVPEFLKRTRMFQPVFKTDMHNRQFGHSPMVAWESFVKELSTMKTRVSNGGD